MVAGRVAGLEVLALETRPILRHQVPIGFAYDIRPSEPQLTTPHLVLSLHIKEIAAKLNVRSCSSVSDRS